MVTVTIQILQSDLFASLYAEYVNGVDLNASADRYCDILQRRLQEWLPDAELVIELVRGDSGFVRAPLIQGTTNWNRGEFILDLVNLMESIEDDDWLVMVS